MTLVGFEHAIPASELPPTYALNDAASGIGTGECYRGILKPLF